MHRLRSVGLPRQLAVSVVSGRPPCGSARLAGDVPGGQQSVKESLGCSEGVPPLAGVLQFVELFRTVGDPFHYPVATQDDNVAVKLPRDGQSTVWIFCRIRMVLDVLGSVRIPSVIKVGVLFGEKYSVSVVAHSVVLVNLVKIELGLCFCYRAGSVGWNQ
jgi:hypothetical protein